MTEATILETASDMRASSVTHSPNQALNLVQDIRRRANTRKMLDRPFFQVLKARKLADEEMKEFFCQYYSIVITSYQMLAAGVMSATPTDADSIAHLVRFLGTEAGGEPNHLGYYLRWAEHFGVTVEHLERAERNAHSKRFSEVLMSYYNTEDGFVKRAAQLGTEDCAEVLIEGLDQGFKQYALPTRPNGYLMAHLLLENDEDGHSAWAIDSLVVDPQLVDRLGDLEDIHCNVYNAFAGVFDGIHEAWEKMPGWVRT